MVSCFDIYFTKPIIFFCLETEKALDEKDRDSENNHFVENTDHGTLSSEKNISKSDETSKSFISSKLSERRQSEDLKKSLTTLQSDLTPR